VSGFKLGFHFVLSQPTALRSIPAYGAPREADPSRFPPRFARGWRPLTSDLCLLIHGWRFAYPGYACFVPSRLRGFAASR